MTDLYQTLPPESRGRNADNPDLYERALTHHNPESWPYLALCEDQATQILTWHLVCDEVETVYQFQNPLLRMVIEDDISRTRKLRLKILEVIDRDRKTHHFLDDKLE